MITIVLTYRDRDLNIAKKCLDSLKFQSVNTFEVYLINYGSNIVYSKKVKELVEEYSFVKLIHCPVDGQLWNKSRAINIVLKQCVTPRFLVGDIDMIYHHDFIKTLYMCSSESVTYFQVGFLSELESKEDKDFDAYRISFKSGIEATGITLFNTNTLKSINGYDEFYHGWGGEDTDVHVRLRNYGLDFKFYDKDILVKHQWHSKTYRAKISEKPFHSNLERINYNYLLFSKSNRRIYANLNSDWGLIPSEEDYSKLYQKPDLEINISNNVLQFYALLAQFGNFKEEVIKIKIKNVKLSERIKQQLKRIGKRKYVSYLNMESLNNHLLETIINNYRHLPYHYSFDRKTNEINLIIYFKE